MNDRALTKIKLLNFIFDVVDSKTTRNRLTIVLEEKKSPRVSKTAAPKEWGQEGGVTIKVKN